MQYDTNDKAKLVRSICEFSCHVYDYRADGSLADEGTLLFDDWPDWETIRYGVWRFYNENGNIIKQIDYKDRYLLDENDY
ncbi:MAG: hypothetical protein U0T73_08640 [Chitinophagales bacterium]